MDYNDILKKREIQDLKISNDLNNLRENNYKDVENFIFFKNSKKEKDIKEDD